jgi:PAS domain S-box-containing protein
MLKCAEGERTLPDKLDDAFFRALFHSPLGGIAVADLSTFTIIEINDVLLRILGCERAAIVGIPHAWRSFTPLEYQPLDERALLQALEQGYSDAFEKEYQRPDGTRVSVRISSSTVAGYPDRLIVFVTELSDERAARERERNAQQRLQIALSAAEQGVWDLDLLTGEMVYSDRAKSIYGLALDQRVTFEQIRDATHPDDLPITHAQFERAINPNIRDRSGYEYRIVRPDGSICWALAYGEAVFRAGPEGEKAIRYAGTIQDITARKLAEQQQAILVAELNHRVKNMLAIVQSLAFQTLRGNDVPEDVTDVLSGRLRALSSAHDLLTTDGWDGASIRQIAFAALQPVAPEFDKRFHVSGDEIQVTPQAAVSFAMTFYELATNAAKYGALSTDQGHVELSWTVNAPDQLFLKWRERGGPPVEPPSRQGFGTRMIQRMLGGKVDLTFAPEGLECLVRAPLKGIVREAGSSNTSGQAFNLGLNASRNQVI